MDFLKFWRCFYVQGGTFWWYRSRFFKICICFEDFGVGGFWLRSTFINLHHLSITIFWSWSNFLIIFADPFYIFSCFRSPHSFTKNQNQDFREIFFDFEVELFNFSLLIDDPSQKPQPLKNLNLTKIKITTTTLFNSIANL